MLLIEALPAIALFIGMLRMPESPRWLVSKGRDDEALRVLSTLRSKDKSLGKATSFRGSYNTGGGRTERPAWKEQLSDRTLAGRPVN